MLTRASMFMLALLVGLGTAPTQAETDLHYNQVRFQVRAVESVSNDRMQAVMAVQDEDEDAARLADRINKAMAWALEKSRGQKVIQVHTGGYSTQPIYQKETISGWRASQELILDSSDFAKLGNMIGVLQQRLKLRAVNFSVAAETRAAIESKLIDKALNDFKQRAEQVRANIGTKTYRIVELNIMTEDSPIQPMPMMHAEAMSKSVATPSFEGGESEVRVSVQGVVELE